MIFAFFLYPFFVLLQVRLRRGVTKRSLYVYNLKKKQIDCNFKKFRIASTVLWEEQPLKLDRLRSISYLSPGIHSFYSPLDLATMHVRV